MNQPELDLKWAGDAAEADSYWYRPAVAGEWCTFCGEPFEVGEIVDVLFITAHLSCIDKLREEHSND